MRKTLLLISILLSSFVFAHAQDKPQAYKFAEFGDVQESVWKQYLDSFSEVLVSLPDAKLHIIVYAESGKSAITIEELVNQYNVYLEETKKVKWENFGVERGGFRNSQSVELWIVPKDSEMPKPTPIEKFKNEKLAEVGYVRDEEFKKLMDGLIGKLIVGEIDSIYIINYGSKAEVVERNKQIYNSIRFRCYQATRLTIVDVENFGNLKTIIWNVPKGEPRPKP